MLVAAAVIWIALEAQGTTPSLDLGRRWAIAAVADVSLMPLFTYPGYENGARMTGGFRFVHPLGRNAEFVWRGRAGGTYVGDWRALFESSAGLEWTSIDVDVRAGLRHDDRLSREGIRAPFRDPTGRMFLELEALPFRKGWFAAGAAVEYQRGMPGSLRLPSSISGAAVMRVRWGCCT
jgi:hypothetical protein